MPTSPPSLASRLFLEMVAAARRGAKMTPRSANDKEYFAQDWFIERLKAISLPYEQQGRNSYPDFWVGQDPQQGFEIKSLAFTAGRPARKDIDFNSTIPSGLKQGRAVFLVFFLYAGSAAEERLVHSLSMVHGDMINSDHLLADEHLNVAVRDFGSYADGFIRNRKMYVFPHPISIDPTGLGRRRLVLPREWKVDDARLIKVGTLSRTVAAEAVDRYTIRLRGRGQAEAVKKVAPDAGRVLSFNVFEAAVDVKSVRGR